MLQMPLLLELIFFFYVFLVLFNNTAVLLTPCINFLYWNFVQSLSESTKFVF